MLIEQDLKRLFDYIEPSDQNLPCYSYRIHELLLRACIEVEANCKAILLENGYAKSGDLRMVDYVKIEASHRLSEYRVRVPVWTGANGVRRPFSNWASRTPLNWYKTYNAAKHDRHSEFQSATFEMMLDAICGCLVVLSAQFMEEEFAGGMDIVISGGLTDGWDYAIGRFFHVDYPKSWAETERYAFKWKELSSQVDPFDNYPYPP
ncbi:MAG TPA: hypothetical protein VMM36_01310 [Opitutaceae bacterium]|nr:hypothetical protein [Opitutaceae bacterium]